MATRTEARLAAPPQPPSATRDTAFSAFYRSELDDQVRRATLLLGSVAHAHDVVHDAMVQVYRRWDTIDRPAAYLTRAVVNGCHTSARRRLVARRKLPALVTEEASAERELLHDVLARLPFRQRAAVVLRYFVGLTNPEIAAALDCATGSVGPWISRALETMRPLLDEGAR